ncbi:hypothetical protein DEAC_c17490 [Desulfosporosinus acididurans]|uniref:Uncharacterized protein n=2 Tax=Desulfosporosinus acididurans TaxID=476652 RepID=A0A0J1FS76_9FIRM|nr:hypothetical protein DEAC_c17490 [Desulfosporosinus acididurans]
MEVYLKANLEKRMVRRDTQSRQALYMAEGGIEWAKAHLLSDFGLRRGEVVFDMGRAAISIESSGGDYKVISEGRSGLAVRKVEEILQEKTGKWIVKSYQELHQ